MVGTTSAGIKLTDDKIVKFVNVLNGFDTIPHRDESFDDFEEL